MSNELTLTLSTDKLTLVAWCWQQQLQSQAMGKGMPRGFMQRATWHKKQNEDPTRSVQNGNYFSYHFYTQVPVGCGKGEREWWQTCVQIDVSCVISIISDTNFPQNEKKRFATQPSSIIMFIACVVRFKLEKITKWICFQPVLPNLFIMSWTMHPPRVPIIEHLMGHLRVTCMLQEWPSLSDVGKLVQGLDALGFLFLSNIISRVQSSRLPKSRCCTIRCLSGVRQIITLRNKEHTMKMCSPTHKLPKLTYHFGIRLDRVQSREQVELESVLKLWGNCDGISTCDDTVSHLQVCTAMNCDTFSICHVPCWIYTFVSVIHTHLLKLARSFLP